MSPTPNSTAQTENYINNLVHTYCKQAYYGGTLDTKHEWSGKNMY